MFRLLRGLPDLTHVEWLNPGGGNPCLYSQLSFTPGAVTGFPGVAQGRGRRWCPWRQQPQEDGAPRSRELL